MTNEALRGHVQRIGFDLSLGRTHIAKLVWVEERRLADYRDLRTPGMADKSPIAAAFRNFVTGSGGLQARGLLIHNYPDKKGANRKLTRAEERNLFKLTRAGRLVVELLKESGIYEEYRVVLARAQIQPVDGAA